LCICWYIINSYYTTVVGREKHTSSQVLGHTGHRTIQDCSRNVMIFEIIVQLGLDQRDMFEDYWSTLDKHFTAFYCNILKQDRLYRVLRFLHFSDNKNEHDKTDVNWTDCGKWQLCLTS